MALAAAVEAGLSEFNSAQEAPLPPRALLLERERLTRLVAGWLQLEMLRETPFRVVACEDRRMVTIEGITVSLILDRMDELEDGSRVILDYKTGEVKHASWADERITEPQLPIYAALAGESVSAVAFAKVLLDKPAFAGIAAVDGLLPGVAGISDIKARKLFGEESFPDWDAVLRHWRDAVAAIAREIRAGDAAVRFADENDLAWCEVRPLLRLPEHKMQQQGGHDA
jgi:exodeoxyribonuclease-5